MMDTQVLKPSYSEKLVRQVLEKVALGDLVPSRLPDGNYTYKAIEEIDHKIDQRELLDALMAKGYLEPVLLETVLVCPKCKRPSAYAVMSCQRCGSLKITRDRLIEHKPFGHLHPESKFQKEGKLVCPTCNKVLKGSDDIKFVGTWFTCINCGDKTNKSSFKFECVFDQTVFSSNDSEIWEVYKYTLGKQAPPITVSGERSSIMEMIRLDYPQLSIKEDISVAGKSGVSHVFDFSVSAAGGMEVLIDIKSAEGAVGNTEILAGYAKMLDTSAKDYVIVILPSLDPSGKALAESYRIQYVEASSVEDAKNKLGGLLRRKLLT